MPHPGWWKLNGCPMLVGQCCLLSTSVTWDCLTLWTFLFLWTPGVPATDWSAQCYRPVGVESVALHCCYVCPKNCNTALSLALHLQACVVIRCVHSCHPFIVEGRTPSASKCMLLPGQFRTIQLPNLPHLFLSSFPCKSYPPFSSFLFVLGHTAHTLNIIAGIPQWCRLFMVCFSLPLVVPPAPSPQYIQVLHMLLIVSSIPRSVYIMPTHIQCKKFGFDC